MSLQLSRLEPSSEQTSLKSAAPVQDASGVALADALRQLLRHNHREGYSKLLGRHYCYIAPSPGTYPYQWFWDTCFHIVMLTRLGEFEAWCSGSSCCRGVAPMCCKLGHRGRPFGRT